MGKKICNTINGMSAKAKTALISLFTLLLTMGMYQGWYLLTSTQAAIGTQTNWTNAFNGTGLAANFTLSINSTANNRLLVVAVTSSVNAAAAQNCTVTYGGKPLTQAVGTGTTSARTHSWLFYLKEADFVGRSSNTVSVNCSGSTANSFTAARYTVYTGVDQTNPIKSPNGMGSATVTSTSTNRLGPLSPTINIAAGEYGVTIINITRPASNTARTVNLSANLAQNWALAVNGTGTGTNTGFTSTVVTRTVAGNSLACNLATSGTNSLSSSAAMVVMPMPATTSLSAVNNTAIATGNKLDSDQSVVMQRFTLTASGLLEINSLSLNDIGTATSVDSAEVYISSSPVQTTLPADAVLIGRVTSWGGGNYAIPLDMGLASNRTLGGSQPLTKHIYITYDMSIGQAGSTVRSQVTGVGVVAPNIGLTGLNLTSNSVGLTASGNLLSTLDPQAAASTPVKDSDAAVIMTYFKVDVNSGFDGAAVLNSVTLKNLGNVNGVDGVKIYIDPTYPGSIPTTVPGTAKLIGYYGEWLKDQVGDTIVVPLNDDYGTAPIDRTVLTGSPKCLYVVYTMRYEDDGIYASLPQPQQIRSQVLAVGAESPDSGVTGLNYLSNNLTLTRGTWSRITSCGGCHDTSNIFDGTARNVPNGKFRGSHRKHTNDYKKDCTDCHARPALTNYGHANGYVNFTSNLVLGYDVSYAYSKGKSFPVSNNPSMGTCSNLYCHSNGTGGTNNAGDNRTVPANTSPSWGGTTNCGSCHGNPPSYISPNPKKNTHQAGGHLVGCVTCHSQTAKGASGFETISSVSRHNNKLYDISAGPGVSFTYAYVVTGGTCNDVSCHGASPNTSTWGGPGPDCLNCHGATKPITQGPLAGTSSRRAVTSEFTLTWSHKASGGKTATKWDCIVCHVEGNMATGGTNGSIHGNGYIELRDPDTGTTIQGVTFGGTGAGSYSQTGSPLQFPRFSRNLGAGTIEAEVAAIQIHHCLKCHDSNGASSTNAQVPTTGSANKPFGATVASTVSYYLYNQAANNTSGAVVDVSSAFNTTNASYHPVKGKQNNPYIKNARLKAPWNTLSPDKTGTNTTSWGKLISCWDCHAPSGTASTVTLTSTVTAHGGASVLRGTYTTTAATLCLLCHTDNYGTSGASNHGSGSAFGSAGDSSRYTISQCGACHGATINTRAIRGQDGHGFNRWAQARTDTVTPANALLSNGTSTGHRPYAFIRSNNMAHVNPSSVVEAWTPSGNKPGCVRVGNSACGNSHGTFGPGGTY